MTSDGSELVGFDADRATGTARESTGDSVLVTAVYTPDDYAILYVSDRLEDKYADDDVEMDIEDAGDLAQQYSQLDFVERETFPSMYPTLDATHAFATFTDFATIVRVVGDDEAFYVSFEAGTEVSPVVGELREIVGKSD